MFSVKTGRKVRFTSPYVQVRDFTVCMKSDFLSYHFFLLFPKFQAEKEWKIDFGQQSLPAGHTCQCALVCGPQSTAVESLHYLCQILKERSSI